MNYQDIAEKIDSYKMLAHGKEVTVFLLSSNRERYIQYAIESILAQTYTDFPLVVLDNFSTDNTRNVIDAYNDPRIIMIQRASTNESPNYLFAMNICVTRYVLVLHDDDILETVFVEEVLKSIKGNEYAAVSVSANLIDENGVSIGKTKNQKQNVVFSGTSYFNQFWSDEPVTMIFPATIYDKIVYKNMDDFFNVAAGPARDQYIWFQTLRYGKKICLLEKNLINYRRHSNQDSIQNAGFMELQLLDALISEEYYCNLIGQIREQIIKREWKIFRLLSRKYVENYIDYSTYQSFFTYECVKYLKESLNGKRVYNIMVFIFNHPKMTKIMIKILLKIRYYIRYIRGGK